MGLLTPTAGHDLFRVHGSQGMLAEEPAVILDGMPGQDINRVVPAAHAGRLKELTFVPADREMKATP
jgi:hypothetical protein